MGFLTSFLYNFRSGMEAFGRRVNIVVVSIALMIVYFVGVGVIHFLGRLFGKRFLFLRPSMKVSSYWMDIVKNDDIKKYYRQF